ncbi:MAG: hypothetical protein Q3962_02630 [Corynebacterium sp.]|nr:hypothetical protein [Corynebacterium sp.]
MAQKILERDYQSTTRTARSTSTATRGRRLSTASTATRTRTDRYGRLGSKQQLTNRGRRVVQPKANPAVIRMLVMVTVVIAGAIAGAMGLSVYTTEQTFHLQDLKATDQTLSNQIETLHRDLEQKQASAALAQHASQSGMVVPNIPGIIQTQQDGTAAEVRAANPTETRPVTDTNSVADDAGKNAASNVATSPTAVTAPSAGLPYSRR